MKGMDERKSLFCSCEIYFMRKNCKDNDSAVVEGRRKSRWFGRELYEQPSESGHKAALEWVRQLCE